jgi:hypothetical protein
MDWPRNDTGPPRWEDAELASWAVRISYLTHTFRIISHFLKVRCSYLPTNTEGGCPPLSAVRKHWRLCPVAGTRGRAVTRWQRRGWRYATRKDSIWKDSALAITRRRSKVANEQWRRWEMTWLRADCSNKILNANKNHGLFPSTISVSHVLLT